MQDMNQAMSVLAAVKHWTLKAENRSGQRYSHSCTIWHNGRRVTAYARTPLAAIERAIAKLSDKGAPVNRITPHLKLVRS